MRLGEVVAAAQDHLSEESGKPLTIMVAGGSATGKSSQVLPKLLEAFGDDALLIEQDRYQLGNDFEDRDSSPYRWDDPRNFQLGRFAYDLRRLKEGEAADVPTFDLRAMGSIATERLVPRPVIIVDGLYALSPDLGDLADFGVYTKMPFYGRFLRRLFRGLLEDQVRPQTPFKHTFGPVLRAHQDFVAPQEGAADCVIETAYSFQDTIDRYGLRPQGPIPDNTKLLWSDRGLSFFIKEEEQDFRFGIACNGELYYHFRVPNEYKQLLDNVDYMAT